MFLALLVNQGNQGVDSFEDGPGGLLYPFPPPPTSFNSTVRRLTQGPGGGQFLPLPQIRGSYTPERSPAPASEHNEGRKTRSGHYGAQASSASRQRAVKTGRVTKRMRRQEAAERSTTLLRPLSELAKGLPNVEVFDIEKFVNRPLEERKEEATDGKRVKRPLNAFILYRKAFQKVAMAYCGTNKNQDASSYCGISWRQLESKSLQRQFKHWAEIEAQRHREAHPAYKYAPKKSEFDVDDDPSSDGEYVEMRTAARPNQQKTAPRQARKRAKAVENDDGELPTMDEAQPLSHADTFGHSSLVARETHHDQWAGPSAQPGFQHHNFPPQYSHAVQTHSQATGSEHLDYYEFGHLAVPEPDWTNVGPGTVDPRLFGDGYSQSWPLGQDMDAFDQLDPDQRLGALMPALDEDGSHNAYLRGQTGDWDVELLREEDIDEAFRAKVPANNDQ